MRAMMTAFRLDPFAMHNGIRGAASAPVHLDEPLVPQTPQWEPRSLSESPLYGLEEQEDEKWAQPDEYVPYTHSTAMSAQQQQQTSVEFEPLMTPAQSLNWSMRYQTSETHASGYPPLPQAQVPAPRTAQTSLAFASRMEQRLPTGYSALTHDRSDEVYRNTRPARMHVPSQHGYNTYANSSNLVNASSNTDGWYRKSIPASYGAEDYYALQQDADSATTTPTPPPFAAPVARRHVWATTYAPDVRALCVA
ncbi:hypothetical protein CERSUDRAFT_116100 [Gelatoporia subvermispora B]|uniref:Uncharacterized protein n=1 Tax=Ceriporiopsis subvermispora (strain B) TaxID=914234 RepID=M2QE17_CERS8|nr:hypothetical protein CERSUDRAFT_116100 [Gelatoporia subvermispora B]